jgi:hypothetical protein
MQSENLKLLARDKQAIAAALVCMLACGIVAWSMFGGGGGGVGKDGKKKKIVYMFMHCPECLDEMPYNTNLKTCNNCEAGAALVPTERSIRDEGPQMSARGKLVVLLVVIAVLGQATAFFLVYRYRLLKRLEEAYKNRVLVCRCPFCKRKLGYNAQKIGSGVTCPRCKTAFVLPKPVEEEEPDPASKSARA